MNPKEIILSAFRRADKERGLRIISSDSYLSLGHMKKADHNLIVMTDLSKLGHEDWVAITAYYAMYQATISLLAKIGLQSKDHATTAAILQYFFSKQIDEGLIKSFNGLKEKKDKIESVVIEDKYIDYLWKAKGARETAQYGISINFREIDEIMKNARDFASKIKIMLNEINEELIANICNKAKELKESLQKV